MTTSIRVSGLSPGPTLWFQGTEIGPFPHMDV